MGLLREVIYTAILTVPQSLAQIYVHIVYSTKNRFPWLRRDTLREDLFGYLVGGCLNLKCPSQRIGGYHDHIHILCSLGRTMSVADLVRELKKSSSEWLKEQDESLKDFYWQAGYGAFSVSPSHVPALIEYIKNQPEHHAQESFQDEFRRICAKYGVEIDERYVWD